jgi:hypothetical protein
MLFFFGARLPQVKGSGDVGGAVEVLPATVDE